MTAGERGAGGYPEDGFHGRVIERLSSFAALVRDFATRATSETTSGR